jgi:signal transduction histidine kinase
MQASLNDIRSGKSSALSGTFPDELQPVADELNLLIKSNGEVLERARTQVGNLAHALKTPLSVLANEAAANPSALGSKVTEQTEAMRTHINLYLDRARRAAQAGTIGATCEIEPVISGIARTLQRIHHDKNINMTMHVPPGLKFRGERQDFEEMTGNLMDNAAKWSKSRIEVKAQQVGARRGRPMLEIVIDDDGPGIPEAQRNFAVRRGERLDESKPGSGLGLSIVRETSAMYGGDLQLESSSVGGLRVRLTLPAIAD